MSTYEMTSGKLIIGCGYLGRRVARRWLAAGHAVTGLVAHDQAAEELASGGIRLIVADVTQAESLPQLGNPQTVLWSVGYNLAGGKSRRQVQIDGLKAVLNHLPTSTGRMIFVSSTSVYGDADGQWVNEDSPCQPTREAGQILLEAEQLLTAHPLGRRAITLRLAGIYGPGRLPASGAAAPDGGYVNLIHVDDAAAVIVAAELRAEPPRTYVVADGQPVERRAYLTYLAELVGKAEGGRSEAEGRRRGGNKRVDSRRMFAELGITLAYPTYREGLAAAVGSE
jgi:nucleoside-diphosphate-sugar epimerase